MEEKKQQALISAVQQAQAQAEMEKKTRKIQKLIPMQTENESQQSPAKKVEGDNISTLSSQIEEKLTIQGKRCYTLHIASYYLCYVYNLNL